MKCLARVLVALLFLLPIGALAQTEGPNLVLNPTLETQNPSNMNLPQFWNLGGFGTNTCTHTYPATPAHDGTKAANVTITSFTSGDCKWYPNQFSVTPGDVMRLSYYLLSNTQTWATAQFQNTDGSFARPDLASPPPSPDMNTWKNVGRYFVVPQNAQFMTVFPLTKTVGTLTVDTFEVHKENVTPLPLQPMQSGNEIPNPSFEDFVTNADGSQSPVSWEMTTPNPACSICKATFNYPVAGIDGPRAAQVFVTNYAASQAKNALGYGWTSNFVNVVGGATYTITDDYISDAQSFVTLEVDTTDSSGRVSSSLQDIGAPMPGLNAQGFKTDFTFPTNAVAAKFTHQLRGLGHLTVDAVSIVPAEGANPSQFSQGMVSLNFDDCNEDQWTNAVPILQAAGLPATFYVITHRLDTDGSFTTSQTIALHNAGHEIGNHTQTHPHLTTQTASQLQAETAGAEQDFRNIGIVPTTFAYPFGEYDDTVIQAVKNIGPVVGARSTNDGPVSRTDDHFTLSRMNLGSTTALADVETAIDSAIANKQWLILVSHHVVPNPSDNFSISPDFLQSVVNYIKQKNAFVVTNAEGLQLMAP